MVKGMDKIFEALSSPVRRKILAYLSKAELSSSEIAGRFEMSKPSISKHLGILENANLVISRKEGQFVYYTLAQDNLVAGMFDFVATICPECLTYKRESDAVDKYKKARQYHDTDDTKGSDKDET